MNKQELIDKHEESYKIIRMDFPHIKVLNELWDDIKQLDEPQKPIVPQFVADWYEVNKDNFETKLFSYLINWYSVTDAPDVKQWIFDNDDSLQILINMHQFGYEIEKGQFYTVQLIKTGQYLYGMGNKLSFVNIIQAEVKNNPMIAFSRRQLEASGFGWVFNCEGLKRRSNEDANRNQANCVIEELAVINLEKFQAYFEGLLAEKKK